MANGKAANLKKQKSGDPKVRPSQVLITLSFCPALPLPLAFVRSIPFLYPAKGAKS